MTAVQLRVVLAALAVALALPALWLDARMFFASALVAWWFWLGLVLGALTNVWIHRLTGGRWGVAMQPVAAWAARRLPWLLLLLLPLATGLSLLYPWAAPPDGAWARPLARPAFALAWFDLRFFGWRMLLYASVWWLLAQPARLRRRGDAAAALVLHSLVGSLASVDLLMSLVPGWFSTAFGLVVLSGQALGGAAGTVLMLAVRAPAAAPAPLPGEPPLWRDFGNLLLMWAMTWAYLAFMEFLIIWAEDLPHEIAWYLPRLHTGWAVVALALALLQFALPVLALLWRVVKDRPRRLAQVAALLLATQLLNTAWLVLPSVAPRSWLGWWLVPLLTLATGLVLFGTGPGSGAHLAEVRHAAA